MLGCGNLDKNILPLSFYRRRADVVAKDLLGKELVFTTKEGSTSGIIVETEAYLGPGDAASHSARGKTGRNATMFGPAGRAYVYLIYGIHYCFNITTDKDTVPSAVLIRALEPRQGIELMQRRRGKENVRELCSGPGKLAQAMGFDKSVDGSSVLTDKLCVRECREVAESEIVTTTRIGITKAAHLPLRFYIANSRYISAP
ncbi:MAG: DNA-3-methyladenine glycosylase [Thermoanaerobacteraceae bacterium]|nr:DNA-3-methyladenine glycosylase [Thermoanaerobacteraceae bacterium]